MRKVRHAPYWLTLRTGTSTGISAHDRALTARKLADPAEIDGRLFTRPGHIFPLRYHEGGVLRRGGHTEASVGSKPPSATGTNFEKIFVV